MLITYYMIEWLNEWFEWRGLNLVDLTRVNRNRNINRGYRKLEVWIEAIELFKIVFDRLEDISTLSFKTKAQIEDSALSVSSNIAEGYCRRSLKENIHFNNIAIASLGENYSQIFALLNANIIDDIWFDIYDEKHYKLENKLIKMNKSLLQKLGTNEWHDVYTTTRENLNTNS